MQHHAHLLVGSKEWALSMLPENLRQSNQDIRHIEVERLSITDVRNLIQEAHLKAVSEAGRTFIIFTKSILHEAQNALLKLFEDPSPATSFYLILPDDEILLPTVRSRLHELGREHRELSSRAFNTFLTSSYADRLSLIENKLKQEDFVWVDEIVASLEAYAEKKRDPRLLEETLTILGFINMKGSSKKLLLEHIALSL